MQIDDQPDGKALSGEPGRTPTLFFLHHHDRRNQGDVLSGPYHYFALGTFKKISWDEDIIKGDATDFAKGDSIIMGGGIFFTKDKPRFAKLVRESANFIGWGLGLDARLDLAEAVKSYSLLGTRERNSSLVDNERVFYVPCSSCMNEAFGDADDKISDEFGARDFRDVVLHVNGGFNAKALLQSSKNMNVTTTVDAFRDIVGNLRSAECVVTNSYHGAYWSSLMGKKVVCIKTDVPKWDGLHRNVVFADAAEITGAVAQARNVPPDYLEECRALNRSFFDKVASALGL